MVNADMKAYVRKPRWQALQYRNRDANYSDFQPITATFLYIT